MKNLLLCTALTLMGGLMVLENSVNADACNNEQASKDCQTVTVNWVYNNWQSAGVLHYTPCSSNEMLFGSKTPNGSKFCAKKGTIIVMTYQGKSERSEHGFKVPDRDFTFLCGGDHRDGRFSSAICNVQ